MTDDNGNSNSSPLDALRRYVPLAVWAMVTLVILAIPLKIIGINYLPADDALRHVAQAMSGKPWPEILVVGPRSRSITITAGIFCCGKFISGANAPPQ